jgi:hypothetical protein
MINTVVNLSQTLKVENLTSIHPGDLVSQQEGRENLGNLVVTQAGSHLMNGLVRRLGLIGSRLENDLTQVERGHHHPIEGHQQVSDISLVAGLGTEVGKEPVVSRTVNPIHIEAKVQHLV